MSQPTRSGESTNPGPSGARAGGPVPVVITAAAAATCLGLDRRAIWEGVRAGRCGIRPLTAIESPLPPGHGGGQAPDLPADFFPDLPREVRYLRWVLRDALREAGIDPAAPPCEPARAAVVIGTTLHGMRGGGKFLRSGDFQQLRDFLAGDVLRNALAGIDFGGAALTTCSACSSSLGAIATGVSMLRSGEADLVIAGGYDPISEYVYGGFNSLRLVAEGPPRPFSKNRTGMRLAEGYAVVVLRRAEDAARDGSPVLARILGYGESADAHHLTQPHPQGDGAARAVRAALAAARLTPADIDFIGAHATATPDNDAGEYTAFKAVFGEDLKRVPVAGFKSHMGHTLGAAGAVELIMSAMALQAQTVPPCAGITPEELEFEGLNVACGSARPATIRATLNTSLGFGGANTCMILGAPEAPAAPAATSGPRAAPKASFSGCAAPAQEVLITGMGVVLPRAIGNEAWAKLCEAGTALDPGVLVPSITDDQILPLLNARRVRRMAMYVKLTLAATAEALRDAGIADVPAFCASACGVIGSTHGAAQYSYDYYGQIVREGIPAANPMLFAEGVPNAAAAHLSLMTSVKGGCQTVIGTRTAGLDALALAASRVASGEWERAIVGASEEEAPILTQAYAALGLAQAPEAPAGSGFVLGSGSVVLVLESRASMEARGGRARGTVLGWGATGYGQGGGALGAARLLRTLGPADAVFGSAALTRLACYETAIQRRSNVEGPLESIYPLIGDCFSVQPLASLAATLLTGFSVGESSISPGPVASGDAVSYLATDYSGAAAVVRVGKL